MSTDDPKRPPFHYVGELGSPDWKVPGEVETVLDWCRAEQIGRLILWSDTRFDQAHRLYERMGFQRTGERVLPDDLNQTREYGFERPV